MVCRYIILTAMEKLQWTTEENEKDTSEQKSKKRIKKTNILLNLAGRYKCEVECQYKVVGEAGRSLGWRRQNEGAWDVRWTDCAVPPQAVAVMLPHQKVNHFPGMQCLSRKNLLGQALMQMRQQFPLDYDFFPATWLLPKDARALREYCSGCPAGKGRTFIVKPEHQSQGRGIFLTRKPEHIPLHEACVVQRYLCRPYLIEGLKFDLRIYVLVTSVEPLRLFMFEEGLARFATEPYSQPTRDNLAETCMHLTNYAINKDNPKFVFNLSKQDMSVGHKRSLTSVLELLAAKGEDVGGFLTSMKAAIVKTVIAGLPQLQRAYRGCQPENYAGNMCFELLGFDVMVTEKCLPVVLEVNYTPSFTTDTPLDKHIKFNAIRDALVLINISDKTKQQTMRAHHDAVHQRVVTGKRLKLTPAEQHLRREAEFKKRDKYSAAHLGRYQCIYPAPQTFQSYQPFIHHAFFLALPLPKTVLKPSLRNTFVPSLPKDKPAKPSILAITTQNYSEKEDKKQQPILKQYQLQQSFKQQKEQKSQKQQRQEGEEKERKDIPETIIRGLEESPVFENAFQRHEMSGRKVQKLEKKNTRAATAHIRHSEIKTKHQEKKSMNHSTMKEKSQVVMSTLLICDLPNNRREGKEDKNSWHWKLRARAQRERGGN